MKALHVLPSVDACAGGPARSVVLLAEALRLAGIETIVAAAGACGPLSIGINHLAMPGEIPNAKSRAKLAEAIRRSDIVEIHSVWNGTTSVAAALCRRVGVPYVLTPRGMLDPVCLRNRAAMKMVYRWLIDGVTIQGANGFHFLSEEERERAVVGRSLADDMVAVAPNGTPELPDPLPGGVIESRFPELAGRQVVVYLGRLHPIKGIDLQIQALARMREAERPVLLLVGPDNGTWLQLKALARREGVAPWVCRGGEIYGPERFTLLAEAGLVLLTSVYECNPVVAAEALAVGAALLATEGCGLAEAAQAGAIEIVPRTVGDVACAIRELLRNPIRRKGLREKAVRYAATRLNWNHIVQPLIGLYERVVDRKIALEGRNQDRMDRNVI